MGCVQVHFKEALYFHHKVTKKSLWKKDFVEQIMKGKPLIYPKISFDDKVSEMPPAVVPQVSGLSTSRDMLVKRRSRTNSEETKELARCRYDVQEAQEFPEVSKTLVAKSRDAPKMEHEETPVEFHAVPSTAVAYDQVMDYEETNDDAIEKEIDDAYERMEIDEDDDLNLGPTYYEGLQCIAVFDTCSLLNCPTILEECISRGVKVMIPKKVLDELDFQKNGREENNIRSRQIHRLALELQPTGLLIIENREEQAEYLKLEDNRKLANDEIIVLCARYIRDCVAQVSRNLAKKEVQVCFVTADHNCRLRAASYDLRCFDCKELRAFLRNFKSLPSSNLSKDRLGSTKDNQERTDRSRRGERV
ncbi:hypothetical protein L596_023527 [Steinernema carpocapsae]|uniref:PIN domain-containing protein n=1 Tax=Steinernema carpocapsae TaxID=34508 RepID=A0A4U5MDZ3_STECR|nr:hypothetical protein L596_023527 [Steinernema carpocapsae]